MIFEIKLNRCISHFVMKCGLAMHFSDIQGESVWEKRETSLYLEEVQ